METPHQRRLRIAAELDEQTRWPEFGGPSSPSPRAAVTEGAASPSDAADAGADGAAPSTPKDIAA
jgi:hypothetical protein